MQSDLQQTPEHVFLVIRKKAFPTLIRIKPQHKNNLEDTCLSTRSSGVKGCLTVMAACPLSGGWEQPVWLGY